MKHWCYCCCVMISVVVAMWMAKKLYHSYQSGSRFRKSAECGQFWQPNYRTWQQWATCEKRIREIRSLGWKFSSCLCRLTSSHTASERPWSVVFCLCRLTSSHTASEWPWSVVFWHVDVTEGAGSVLGVLISLICLVAFSSSLVTTSSQEAIVSDRWVVQQPMGHHLHCLQHTASSGFAQES